MLKQLFLLCLLLAFTVGDDGDAGSEDDRIGGPRYEDYCDGDLVDRMVDRLLDNLLGGDRRRELKPKQQKMVDFIHLFQEQREKVKALPSANKTTREGGYDAPFPIGDGEELLIEEDDACFNICLLFDVIECFAYDNGPPYLVDMLMQALWSLETEICEEWRYFMDGDWIATYTFRVRGGGGSRREIRAPKENKGTAYKSGSQSRPAAAGPSAPEENALPGAPVSLANKLNKADEDQGSLASFEASYEDRVKPSNENMARPSDEDEISAESLPPVILTYPMSIENGRWIGVDGEPHRFRCRSGRRIEFDGAIPELEEEEPEEEPALRRGRSEYLRFTYGFEEEDGLSREDSTVQGFTMEWRIRGGRGGGRGGGPRLRDVTWMRVYED